nr:hypothetical protein [Aliterella atlantica]
MKYIDGDRALGAFYRQNYTLLRLRLPCRRTTSNPIPTSAVPAILFGSGIGLVSTQSINVSRTNV